MPRSNEIYENKAEWKNFLRNSKFEIRSMPTIGWILIYNFHKIYIDPKPQELSLFLKKVRILFLYIFKGIW